MKTKDAQKDVEELEIQLRIERNKKEKNLSRFNDIITKLNAELADLKDKTEAGRKKLQKETEDSRTTNQQSHESRVKEYEERLEKLREAVSNQQKENGGNNFKTSFPRVRKTMGPACGDRRRFQPVAAVDVAVVACMQCMHA